MKSFNRSMVILWSVFLINAHQPACAADIVAETARRCADKKAYKVALPLCEMLAKNDPQDVQRLCDLANCLLLTRKPQQAQETLQRALAINPESAPASYLLGLIFAKNAQYEKALSLVETSIKTDPSWPSYRLFKVNLLVQTGRIPEARVLLSTIDGDRVPQKAAEEASVLAAEGHLEEGKRRLLEAALKGPDDLGNKFGYAEKVVHDKTATPDELKRAAAFMEEVIAKSNTTPLEIAPDCLLYFILANAEAGSGQFDLATVFQTYAISNFEERCGVPKSAFERALAEFSTGKRFFPKLPGEKRDRQ